MMLRLFVSLFFTLTLAAASPGSAAAQGANGSRFKSVADTLAEVSSSVRDLDNQQRQRVSEFVIGNALFVLTHELGHAAVSEFDLPVLGREEDAVDTFATLAFLHISSDFSHRILINAALGHYLIGERSLKQGNELVFYGEHGLDKQRAYQIICLMVGSDPDMFWGVAARAGLPVERKETCHADFEKAAPSWVRLLQQHFKPATSRPSFLERLLDLTPRSKDRVIVDYSEATGKTELYREVLKTAGILELVRDFVEKNLAFPKRIFLEGKACGEPNAYWDPSAGRITFCYELVPDFVELAVHDLH